MGRFGKSPSEKRKNEHLYRRNALQLKSLFENVESPLMELPREIIVKIVEYVGTMPLFPMLKEEDTLEVKTNAMEVDAGAGDSSEGQLVRLKKGKKRKRKTIRAQKKTANAIVNRMLNLRVLCSEMLAIVQENANFLPKIQLSDLRIKFERFVGSVPYVQLYRYGNGYNEKPCLFIKLDRISQFLVYHKISGRVVVDGFQITDQLLFALLSLDWSNVSEFIFLNINGVNLTSKELMSELMGRLAHVQSLRFFGLYDEADLFTEEGTKVHFEREELDEKEITCAAKKFRFWKRIRKERHQRFVTQNDQNPSTFSFD